MDTASNPVAASPVEDRFLSLNGAAEELGESRGGILARIARKELDTDYVAGRTVVTRESVERVRQQKEAEAEKAEHDKSKQKRTEPSSRRKSRSRG